MPPDLLTILIVCTGVFIIAFMKGAFGGGFAIVGIPMLALAMDPVEAGALLAPLFVAMDMVALYYWRPATWSRPDLVRLLPGLFVGMALGYLALSILDRDMVSVVIALITLGFVALWFRGGGRVVRRPRSVLKAMAAGTGSGLSTMIAHSGGPPLAMYLLPLGMSKAVYAGTTSLFFTVGNIAKAGPWLWLGQPDARLWQLMGYGALAILPGVWAGWHLHRRLDERQLYRACYALLVVVALKLLWDGLT